MDNRKLRSCLYEIYRKINKDHFFPAFKIYDINTSAERDEIALKLVNLGCLKDDWIPVGRDGIQGTFYYEQVKRVIESGRIG